MKKNIMISFMVVLMLVLCACGNADSTPIEQVSAPVTVPSDSAVHSDDETVAEDKEVSEKTDDKLPKEKTDDKLTKSDLNIEDFDWGVEQGIVDGNRVVTAYLTNNSDYDLIGYQIEFRLIDEITDEITALFEDVMIDHEGYLDSVSDIFVRGYTEEFVGSGDSVNDIILYLGTDFFSFFDAVSANQMEYVNPDIITFNIIGKDNRVYYAYYDAVFDSWSVEDAGTRVGEWPSTSIGEAIPMPGFGIVTVDEDHCAQDSIFPFFDSEVYNVTTDDYHSYIDLLTEMGFTNEVFQGSSMFMGTNSDGFNVYVNYSSDTLEMSISCHKY